MTRKTLLCGLIAALAAEKWPAELVMLAALLALVCCGVIKIDDALKGFSNPAMLTIAAAAFEETLHHSLRLDGSGFAAWVHVDDRRAPGASDVWDEKERRDDISRFALEDIHFD